MVDVAASGGYYLAMACDAIVAEDMTITGSIGVVSAKFNLQKLFEKIGVYVRECVEIYYLWVCVCIVFFGAHCILYSITT
jgi:membrane-bound ClpP family serine protease